MAADSLPGQMRSAATTLLAARSEEHTSELLSHVNLVCRLLLEKKNKVALVVVDSSEGITAQDAHLAGYANEAGRAVVIVVNKWDLVPCGLFRKALFFF